MRIYEAASALVNDHLAEGQYVQTKGLAVSGDGKGAFYLIKTAIDVPSPTAVDVVLANTNVAVFQRWITHEGYVDAGAVSGAVAFDCADGLNGTFEFSTSAAITGITLNNVPANPGIAFGVVFIIEIGATPDAIAFGAAFDWGADGAPAFDTASTKEVVVAFTVDGGTSWMAKLAIQGVTV